MKLEAKQRLLEAIVFNDDELTPGTGFQVHYLSQGNLNRAFDEIGTIKNLQIYLKKDMTAVYAVIPNQTPTDTYVIAGLIRLRPNPYPVEPKVNSACVQISYVSVDKPYADSGVARAMYRALLTHTTVVSDHEHYVGGKAIWDSLVKDPTIHIYVWLTDKFLTDAQGQPKRLPTPLPKNLIWDGKRTTLLVASLKDLTTET